MKSGAVNVCRPAGASIAPRMWAVSVAYQYALPACGTSRVTVRPFTDVA